MTDEVTIHFCAGCHTSKRGIQHFVPDGWHKVTVRVGADVVTKNACCRMCVASILRSVADHIIVNDDAAHVLASGQPYR